MTTRKQNTTPAAAEATTEQKQEYVVSGVKVSDETKIKFIENPKRRNSQAWERYEKYQTATTWAEYRKLNDGKFMMADARHDLGKEFLKVLDTK